MAIIGLIGAGNVGGALARRLTQSSGAPTGSYVGGKVYSMVGKTSTNQIGALCTDVSALPFTSCGYSPLVTGASSWNYIGSQVLVGTRLYAAVSSPTGEVLCFDVATGVACASQPYALSGLSGISSVPAFAVASDGKLFITANKVWCLDAATGALCAGSWPVSPAGGNQHSLEPRYDASSVLVGVCQVYGSYGCWDLTGAATSAPAGLVTALSSRPVGQMTGWAQYLTANHRFYWFSDDSNWIGVDNCYNWTTDAPCAGFTPQSLNTSRYAMRLDTANPNCIWHNGDNGQIGSFDATTGSAGCTSPYPIVSIPYTNVVPRLSCSEAGRVREWKSITLNAPAGVDVTALKMTVNDAFGNTIPGFVDQQPNAAGLIDLSTLAVSATGTQPTFIVKVIGATNTQAADLTAAVQYASDSPEICLTLTTIHNCPALAPGLSAGPTVVADALNIAASTVATAGGIDTTTPLSATVSQADVAGCVGALTGTATHTFGSNGTTPIAGGTVNLVGPDGTTVLASTTTAPNGGYSFANVNPAGYTVSLETAAQPATISAGGSAVVPLIIAVAPPTASDVSSATLQNTPTTFAVSATTDPVTTLDHSSTLIYNASSATYGTSLTVAGEGTWTVSAGGNLTFTPLIGFTGTTASVTYQVAHLLGVEATALAQVTVSTVLPTASPVAVTGVQGDTVVVTPNGQSSSVALDANSLGLIDTTTGQVVTTLTVPNTGTFTVDRTTGTVSFVPLAGFSGATTVIYQVLDVLGRNATSIITVTLTPLVPVGGSVTVVPLNPTGGTVTVKPGVTASVPVTGVPADSTITVGSGVKHVVSVTVSGTTVIVVPQPGFSGTITVPVVVHHGSASANATVIVMVRPVGVASGSHTLDRNGNSVVSWKPSASAGGYEVLVNGVRMCTATLAHCRITGPLGPKAVVRIVTKSRDGSLVAANTMKVPYRFTVCAIVGAAHFDTDSSAIALDTHVQVVRFGRTLKAQGFTHSCLTGYTDSRAGVAYNKALSMRRVNAVGHELAVWMRHQRMQKVGMKTGYQGLSHPVATNNSSTGQAANRRVSLGLG